MNTIILFFILISTLCILYTKGDGIFALINSRDNEILSMEEPGSHPLQRNLRPREKSDFWQKEYPISPHRKIMPAEDSPYYSRNRRERRVLRNIINAGVHKMDLKHKKRMNEREIARSSEDSFQDSRIQCVDSETSGYYSDISEPFDDSGIYDSFAHLESAPYYSEEEGEYSNYPIIGFEEDFNISNIDDFAATPHTAHKRSIFDDSKPRTPSKVTEIIERGSDKTLRGRRRERRHRQHSRGAQSSVTSVPRRLNFSPHYRSAHNLPNKYKESPDLPTPLNFVDPTLARDQHRKEERQEADDMGVRSVKNYAAQINSRLRENQ